MPTIRDVLMRIRDSGGSARFAADDLVFPVNEFQLVVELVRGAYYSGYIDTLKEHRASRTGLVDCIWAEGLTDDGKEYLAAA